MKPSHLLIFAVCLVILKCGVVEQLANRDPVIRDMTFSADSSYVFVGDTLEISVEASDPDKDELFYTWSATGGYFISKSGATALWVAPGEEGRYRIEVAVHDKNEGKAVESLTITVLENREPSVFITYPGNGDVFVGLGHIPVKAQAAPVEFINRVEFYCDGKFIGSDPSSPYEQILLLDGMTGRKKIRAIAYRTIPSVKTASDSLLIMIEGVVPIPK
ncbi:hypothetical protein JW935_29355 [candidate division KSB1 bacterium]|nr:hypothetical protein [candidate division KSB1 bacterium]